MRAAKTTKEIDVAELEQLKNPEARETAAFDSRELQGLIAASRGDDELALPLDTPAAPPPATHDAGDRSTVARVGARTPATLVPWIIAVLATAMMIALAFWR